MRLETMRWYVLCTVVSTFAGAAAAFCVKVLPRDANWRVTCRTTARGRNRGEDVHATSRDARVASGKRREARGERAAARAS